MTLPPKGAPLLRTTDQLLIELQELELRMASNTPSRDLVERARVRIKLLVVERDALSKGLRTAIDRMEDMLPADDGQAFKEAERVMPGLRDTLARYSA